MSVDFARYIEPVARHFHGDPNKALSSKSELRFGTNGSLSVDLGKGTFFDHEASAGGGVLDLVERETGHANRDAVEWLRDNIASDIPDDRQDGGNGSRYSGRRIEAIYDYFDENAELVYQAVRFRNDDASKTFRQRRPDGQGGWNWSVKGVQPVPYKLADILSSDPDRAVFVVEGEKDADRLASLGLIATTNAAGAGKWRDELSAYLADRAVVILPDNDDAGAAHAEQVARSLHNIAASVTVANLPDLKLKGDVSDWLDDGGTVEALRTIVDQAPAWRPGEADDAPDPGGIVATPYVWTPGHLIPRREWLYGRHLIRKFASGTVAPGGTGKTALVIAEALAMVSGRDLLGKNDTADKSRVWLYNLEDPMEELTRRIQGACDQHGLGPDDIGDRLHVNSGRDAPLVIAAQGPDGLTINRPVVDELVTQLTTKAIDVLVVDPFVSSHSLPENDNSAIDAAVKEWGRVAGLANCAVELVHHVRKNGGEEVTAEDARGGKAFVDGLRSVRVLNRMTKDDAAKAGIEDGHWRYFRAELGKANMAPAEKADWYRLASVDLGNGDNQGVVTTWTWPDPFAAVSAHDLLAVQRGIADGEWREDVRADHWAGKVVADVLGLDPDDKADRTRIKALLKTWIGNGSFRTERRKDEKARREYTYILVGARAKP